jgi:hypothetical protein
MKFVHITGSKSDTYNYYSMMAGPGSAAALKGFVEKINGKWYVHRQYSVADDVDLTRAAGPFPTLKSAKAACRLLYG